MQGNMKTQTYRLILLFLFAVSSFEAVWASKFIDSSERNELHNVANKEVDILEAVGDATKECLVKKATVICFETRCLKKCTADGFIDGQCTRKDGDFLKKCYCQKDGCDTQIPSGDSDIPASPAPYDSLSDLSPSSDFSSDLSPSSSPIY